MAKINDGRYIAINTDYVFHSLDNETANKFVNNITLNKSKLKAKLLNFGLYSRIIERKISSDMPQGSK